MGKFKKYNIKYALLEKQKPEKKNILEFAIEILASRVHTKTLEEKLSDDGWSRVYEDNTSVVYIRN